MNPPKPKKRQISQQELKFEEFIERNRKKRNAPANANDGDSTTVEPSSKNSPETADSSIDESAKDKSSSETSGSSNAASDPLTADNVKSNDEPTTTDSSTNAISPTAIDATSDDKPKTDTPQDAKSRDAAAPTTSSRDPTGNGETRPTTVTDATTDAESPANVTIDEKNNDLPIANASNDAKTVNEIESATPANVESTPVDAESSSPRPAGKRRRASIEDVPAENAEYVKLDESDITKRYKYDADSDDEATDSDASHSRKTRGVGRTFKQFMEEFKKFVGGGASKSLGQLSELTSTVKSGVKSFDDVIANIPTKQAKNGVISMGERTVGAVHRLAREGNLSGLAKLSKSSVNIVESDKRAFSQLTGITPEKQLHEIGESAASVKKLRPSLDVPAKDIDKLPVAAKSKLKTVTDNLLKKFKTGTVIALTVGAIYVGVDWISKATQARAGCYMLTTINNKTTSCKLAAYTCSGDVNANACSGAAPAYYNVTLVLIAISQMSEESDTKVALCEQLKIEPVKLAGSLKTVIDNQFMTVKTFVDKLTTHPKYTICGLKSSEVENGVIPDCRMCSPSADPTSTMFIDPAQYPDNVTFQCVTNPSILDTITDAAVSTATDLWQGVGKALNLPVRKIVIGVTVSTIVLFLVWIMVRLFARSNVAGMRTAPPSYVRLQGNPVQY